MISPEQEAGLLSLWEHATEHWNQGSAHEAFLQACSEQKELAFAASRYRKELESNREDRATVATAQLEKITALAFAQIDAERTVPKNNRRVITILSVFVSLGLIVACAYLISL